MKKEEKLMRAISLADDELLAKAAPHTSKPNQNRFWIKFSLYAAIVTLLALMIVLPITLMNRGKHTPVSVTSKESSAVFTESGVTQAPSATQEPGNTLPPYANSPYFPLLDKLSGFYQDPNDTEEEDSGARPGATTAAIAIMPSPDEPTERPTPDDITDNQVEGVIEADRIKRTDTHIFYLRANTLEAYTIAGLDSACVGKYDLVNGNCRDFYLLDNGKKALFLTHSYSYPNGEAVELILLDVSKPEEIKEIKKVRLCGSLYDSRMNGNTLLLFTQYWPNAQFDYDNPATFVPTIDEGNGALPLAPEDILMPEEVDFFRYGTVCVLDLMTLTLKGTKALLDGFEHLYVSKEHIYLAAQRKETIVEGDYSTRRNLTDILCLSYAGDSLLEKGRVTLEGFVKDQYSFDEKDGILRVVTTVNTYTHKIYKPITPPSADTPVDSIPVGTTQVPVDEVTIVPVPFTTAPYIEETVIAVEDTVVPVEPVVTAPPVTSLPVTSLPVTPLAVTWEAREMSAEMGAPTPQLGFFTNASLYCVSLESFEIVASVENFAPEGESVQSVRFEGDSAYVCTSIVFSDPVFFFDLSDLSNITYTDTGVIEGYSSSLIDFGEGTLLGIGFEDWDTVKIEVYQEKEDAVVSVDRYVTDSLVQCFISSDYKAYYINRENKLLGFAMQTVESDNMGINQKTHYILLHFDGEKLTELEKLESSGDLSQHRAVYIDGYLYVFNRNGLQVASVTLPQ